mgnify:CR=1 FL=1
MKLSKYVACICEGGAEKTIIELLLDSNSLIFSYDDLLEGEILRCRKARDFETQYLRKYFNEKVTVLRILDSRRERFALSKAYAHKVDVINVVTAPEIEMLVILSENKYKEFKGSNLKPSEYCKSFLGYSNVKRPVFIEAYFKDLDKLITAIKRYKKVSKINHGEYALADLLK